MPIQSITDAPGPLPGEYVDPRVAEFAASYGPVLDHWQEPFTIRTDLPTVEQYGTGATVTTTRDGVTVTTTMDFHGEVVHLTAYATHPVKLTVTLW